MRSLKIITGIFVLVLLSGLTLQAQNPTIEGNLLLCPFGTSTLSTQEYDAYQWYKREYFGDEVILLEGETNQTLEVSSPDFSVVYVSVKVWLGEVEYTSPEVLVDELVFPPIVVQSTGDFTIGPNGESILQDGDVMYFTVMGMSSNIQWYRNEEPIPGETGTVLEVTQSGIYQARGGYGQCPDYPLQWTLPLEVIVQGGVGVEDISNSDAGIRVWPNPANDMVRVTADKGRINRISLYDPAGRMVLSATQLLGDINLSSVTSGVYFLTVSMENGTLETIRIQKL